MRLPALRPLLLLLCVIHSSAQQPLGTVLTAGPYVGFDINDYPGDQTLPTLRRHFAFAGYWLNNPPGERQNGWVGKREALVRNGFGFLVLFNGRLEAEIMKEKRSGTSPASLGTKDVAQGQIGLPQGEHLPAYGTRGNRGDALPRWRCDFG